MSSKRPKIYFIANNGIKIELKGSGPASFYAQEQVKNELAKAFQVPKDMLFPTEILALTDKKKMKGSIELCSEKEKNHTT